MTNVRLRVTLFVARKLLAQKLIMQNRQKLFGVEIDAVRMNEAVERIFRWIDEPQDQCQFVVTPNVDHTVLLRENEQLRNAYRDSGLVLADGHPVVMAARFLGKPLPERVPGSDLVPRVFSAAGDRTPITTFLLGAATGVADIAAENIESKWENVYVTGTYSPPLGFENDTAECEKILALINRAQPDILIVGLGAPKQELWTHRFQDRINARVALCVGATIDFLAGEKKRAPRWVQAIGMEWLHRIGTDPKRLFKRYAKDAWIFPQLVWNEWSKPEETDAAS